MCVCMTPNSPSSNVLAQKGVFVLLLPDTHHASGGNKVRALATGDSSPAFFPPALLLLLSSSFYQSLIIAFKACPTEQTFGPRHDSKKITLA